MSKKTLLLDSTYRVLAFIPERKTFKLLFKEKVEALSNWEEVIKWGNDQIYHPAVLKLNHQIKRTFKNSSFSRGAVVKRDKSRCQYCDQKLSASQITIDHIIPKCKGGVTSFINCVISCKECNNKKGDKTLEESGMVLLKKPVNPYFSDDIVLVNHPNDYWHPSWDEYLSY